MSTELHQIANKRTRPGFLWLLSLAALGLTLWQIPFLNLVHREAGTRAFLQAISQNQSSPTGYRRVVFVEADTEDLAKAVSQLEQTTGGLDAPLRTPDTYRILGVAELAANNPTGAQSWLQRRLEIAPDDVIARFFLGETYLRLGDLQTTIEQWEAIGAQAQLMELGRELITRGELVKALVALEAIMRLDATNEDSRRLAAKIWTIQGHPERALALYQEISAIDPENSLSADLSGRALFDEGQYEPAIVFFEQALAHNSPNPRRTLELLGRSYAALGHWPEAITAYERAIHEDPTVFDVFMLMADAQCQVGQPGEARVYYERAVTLGNRSERVIKAALYIAQHGECPPPPPDRENPAQ